ncbi:MAG: hypothetical protein IPL79_11075 [Myxococcales bacterium]|nr:hypothetical protein [Myxococcales bacterium]
MSVLAFAPMGKHRVLVAGATAVAAFALAAAVVGRSCRWNTSAPEEVATQFVAASKARDREAVFALLSPATRARLAAQAERATNLVGGSRRYEALDMISISETDRFAPVQVGDAVIRGDRRWCRSPARRAAMSLAWSS